MEKFSKFAKCILFIILSNGVTQSFCQSMSADIDNIYNFSPNKLTRKEQEGKIKYLDEFWNKVKSDSTLYLPQLRRELTTNTHNPYFYFDGTGLLLSISHTKADKILAAESIAKCDLKDIDQKIYVQTLNSLAFDSINISKAALKILDYPNFRFYLVQHVMYFNQDNCLAYCLLPMNDNFYIDTIINRFSTADTTGQFSILYTLWLGYSCKGDSLIHASSKNIALPKVVRDFADTLSQVNYPIDNDNVGKSFDQLIDMHKRALRRFSDEGVSDLMASTMAMRNTTKCSIKFDTSEK
jgi:hypothetical protein